METAYEGDILNTMKPIKDRLQKLLGVSSAHYDAMISNDPLAPPTPCCPGSPNMWYEGCRTNTARVMYIQRYGTLPEGTHIRRSCKTKRCVNPGCQRPYHREGSLTTMLTAASISYSQFVTWQAAPGGDHPCCAGPERIRIGTYCVRTARALYGYLHDLPLRHPWQVRRQCSTPDCITPAHHELIETRSTDIAGTLKPSDYIDRLLFAGIDREPDDLARELKAPVAVIAAALDLIFEGGS